jgi:polyisoprenoid-binding protein YceI
MALHSGRHVLGPDQGRVALLTARDGLAAQAGHDLTIEVSVWSGELTVADDGQPTELSVTLEMNSLVVREGTGGMKPLTDRDRREIAITSKKVLGAERHPEASFTSTGFEPNANGGGFIQGNLMLGGISRPLKLHVAKTGPESYHATASVRQSEFGIKPYTAFLGALKVSDAVGVNIDIDLTKSSAADDAAADSSAAGHSAGGGSHG